MLLTVIGVGWIHGTNSMLAGALLLYAVPDTIGYGSNAERTLRPTNASGLFHAVGPVTGICAS